MGGQKIILGGHLPPLAPPPPPPGAATVFTLRSVVCSLRGIQMYRSNQNKNLLYRWIKLA